MTPPAPLLEVGLLVRGERGGEDGARLVTSESVLACILALSLGWICLSKQSGQWQRKKEA
jgi:hypothetical protein